MAKLIGFLVLCFVALALLFPACGHHSSDPCDTHAGTVFMSPDKTLVMCGGGEVFQRAPDGTWEQTNG